MAIWPDETAARLIEASEDPEKFHQVYETVQSLPLEYRQQVFTRLAEDTPNPTGDR